MSTIPKPKPRELGEPTWEIAHLFPLQGSWTEEEYLALSTNRLVEFSSGCVEVLPMPTLLHQLILLVFRDALKAFASPKGLGRVVVAPYKVRLWKGKFREPDVVFLLAEHLARMGEQGRTTWFVITQPGGNDVGQ